jgi:hypothetical protein
MQARYRQDYPGEFVVTNSTWTNGQKQQTREWVANPIVNQHLTGGAACIGSAAHKELFDHTILATHRGGLLGSKKLQTYGIAKMAQEMRLDFAVDTVYANLEPLITNKYVESNIVYTTARNCIDHPGEFYLIPQAPYVSALAMPLYLAAFDGHKEIYLIGYCNDTQSDRSSWIDEIASIISAYAEVRFTIVGPENNIPDKWLAQPNTRVYTYNEFISYCDV